MALVLNNISGSKDQDSTIGITGSVKIGRPLGAQDLPAMPGTDVTFFVSGAIGKKSTTDTHASTAVVGGDAVISGSLYVDNDIFASEYIKHSEDSNTSIRFQDDDIQINGGGDVSIRLSENSHQDHISLNNLANDVDIFIYAEDGESGGSWAQTPSGKTLFHGVAASGGEQVLILSGGGGTSLNEAGGNDVAFYVSGSVGSRGTAARGTAVFGGDVYVSGTLYSDDLTVTDDLTLSDDLTVGGNVFLADGTEGAPSLTFTSDTDTGLFWETHSLNITAGGAHVIKAALSSVIFNEDGDDMDFRVEGAGGTKMGMILVDAGTEQVALLTDGRNASEAYGLNASTDPIPLDTNLFVSGSMGSRGTSGPPGTAVFGGDVYVSGALYSDDITITDDLSIGDDLNVSGVVSGSSVETGLLFSDSGDLVIHNQASDKDIIFKVNDGGSTATLLTMDADIPVIQTADGIKQSFGSPNTFISGSATPGRGLGLAIKSNKCIWISGSQGVFFGKRTGTGNQDQGNDAGVPSSIGNDTIFFVSGTAGSAGTSDRGTAVFGGDVVISGTLSGGSPLIIGGDVQVSGTIDVSATTALKSTAISGSLTHLADGTSYLIAGSNVTITTGSNGAVTIASTASGGGGGGGAGSEGWIAPANQVISTTGSLKIGTADENNPDINLGSDGSAVFNEQGSSVDFRVASNNKSHAIFVDGSTDQVLILSGGAQTSLHATNFADTNFFVSGSIGSRGTAKRGTAVFGGDAVVSGTLSVGSGTVGDQSLNVYANASGKFASEFYNAEGSEGHTMLLKAAGNGYQTHILDAVRDADGTAAAVFRVRADGKIGMGINGVASMGAANPWVVTVGGSAESDDPVSAISDIAISQRLQHVGDSNTYMHFHSDEDQIKWVAGGYSMVEMIEESSKPRVLILSGGGGTSPDEGAYQDTNFFVSGSMGSMGTTTRGTAVFGGDTFMSGALEVGLRSSESTDGLDVPAFVVNTKNYRERIYVDSDNDRIILGKNGDGGVSASGYGSDTFFFVSGSRAARAGDNPRVAVFGGDTVTSGNVRMYNIGSPVTGAHLGMWNDQTIAGDGGSVRLEMATGFSTEDAAGGSKFTIQKSSVNNPYMFGGPHSLTMRNLSGSMIFTVGNSTDYGYGGQWGISLTDGYGKSYFEGSGLSGDYASAGYESRVAILSGTRSGPNSPNEANYKDINFFVSGNMGSLNTQDTLNRGTALFGGDVAVSGGLHVGFPPGETTQGSKQNFVVNTQNIMGAIKVDGTNDTVHFAGTSDQSGELHPGQDAFFWVSGSMSGETSGKDSHGVAVFGGDVVVSGTLWGGNNPAAGGSSLLMQRADIHIVQGNAVSDVLGTDVSVFISGSRGDRIYKPHLRGTTVAGGDIATSGSIIGVDNTMAVHGATDVLNLKAGNGGLSFQGGNAQFRNHWSYEQLSQSEASDTFFFVSGSAGHKGQSESSGMAVFGGDTIVSGTLFANQTLAVGTNGTYSKTALTVVHNYASPTFDNVLSDGDGGGEVILYGSGQQGSAATLHFLHTDGSWDSTDADAVATGASQLLAIAVGTSPTAHGMLLGGFVRIPAAAIEGTAARGMPVYVSEEPGKFDFTAPSASGDFVRVIGYCIDIDGSNNILLHFKPDGTWVEIA